MVIAIAAGLANIAFVGLMVLVEAILGKLKLIPKRNQSFPYLMDRDLFRIGYLAGGSLLVMGAGGILELVGFPPLWGMILVSLLNIAFVAMMHKMVWLRQQKRDSLYPPGGVSLLGRVHLLYVGGVGAWDLSSFWGGDLKDLLNLRFQGFLLMSAIGAGIWIWTGLRDRTRV